MAIGMVNTETEIPPHRLIALADHAMLHCKTEKRAAHHGIIKRWIKQQLGTPIRCKDTRL